MTSSAGSLLPLCWRTNLVRVHARSLTDLRSHSSTGGFKRERLALGRSPPLTHKERKNKMDKTFKNLRKIETKSMNKIATSMALKQAANYLVLVLIWTRLELELVATQFAMDVANQHSSMWCNTTVETDPQLYIPTHWLYKIIVTYPVTVASCERPLPTLRRLKTWVRNYGRRASGSADVNNIIDRFVPRSKKFHLFCTCNCKSYLSFLLSIKNFPLLKYFLLKTIIPLLYSQPTHYDAH